MKRLADLGLPQFVLPPHERPNIPFLRSLGFAGSDAAVLERAWKEAPSFAAAACSASPMWAANAATVTPSADSADGRVHFTPANLVTNLHRSLEHAQTKQSLDALFSDPARFAVHDALVSRRPPRRRGRSQPRPSVRGSRFAWRQPPGLGPRRLRGVGRPLPRPPDAPGVRGHRPPSRRIGRGPGPAIPRRHRRRHLPQRRGLRRRARDPVPPRAGLRRHGRHAHRDPRRR
jgi:hypothetical protein